jgi:carboxymethylenebutenolidase
MRKRHSLAAIFLLTAPATPIPGQTPRAIAADTVVVPSGTLRLRALLWMPDGPGPFPAILFNPGAGCSIPPAVAARAADIGPTFVKHGYAFLVLFRRGDGLSADQGSCMGDLLRREEAAKGLEARKHLQLVLLTTEQLADVRAGVAYLRSLPRVDARQIGVAGHSFGGQLTLLAAEQDSSIRAVVTFAAAAASWAGSAELRTRLLVAVQGATVPVMLVHAADDSSTAPAYALASELARLGKRHVLKILPDHGHGAVYTAIPQWEPDVFRFLDSYLRP